MRARVKEALINSSTSRVADQIVMIASRATKVVAETTMPRRSTKRARDLAATLMGRGYSGELPRCAACQGEQPLTARHALHLIPQSRRRDRVGINQRFLKL